MLAVGVPITLFRYRVVILILNPDSPSPDARQFRLVSAKMTVGLRWLYAAGDPFCVSRHIMNTGESPGAR